MSATVVVPDHLGVSRIKTLDKCALAYRYQYIEKLPAPQESASKLFGTVVHLGVERWYGDPGSENHRSTQLGSYVVEAWKEQLPKPIMSKLRHCLTAQADLSALESAIRISRPQIKGPTQTKDYMNSPEFARMADTRDHLMAACSKQEDIRWPKDENPLQAYNKSLLIAKQLQDRWQRHPRPLVVEAFFDIEFAGVRFHGRIDQIRSDPDPQGQTLIELLDLKTGRQLFTQMEAFLQAFLYNEACIEDPALPEPDHVTFWLARHNRPQHGRIDRERHSKLARRIVSSIQTRLESGEYAPAYGMWCKSCDFAGLCQQEINMWPPDKDSLVLGATP